MAHVEPTGLPVDAMEPALRDALCDVSAELADAQHTAHGSLHCIGYYGNTLRVTVVVDLGREATIDDAERVLADLGGYDAPVLVRSLARSTEGK